MRNLVSKTAFSPQNDFAEVMNNVGKCNRNADQGARDGHYGVPQFNINNLEWTKAVLTACEK